LDRTPILFVRLAPWKDDEDHDLPRRGYGFRAGMTEQELRDSTRAWWVLSAARAAQMHYIAAVADGYVVGIWRIVDGSWRTIDGHRLGKSPRRWACEVADAPDDVWARVVGQRTPDRPDGGPLFGSGSVVAYWPEPPR